MTAKTQTSFVSPGAHLLIDFYNATNLSDLSLIEKALLQASKACGATVLQIMLHRYGEGGGVTGVALLAESHISIHTWPEINYAAIDVFVCGKCDPQKAVPVLKKLLKPREVILSSHNRGRAAKLWDVFSNPKSTIKKDVDLYSLESPPSLSSRTRTIRSYLPSKGRITRKYKK
jgi:S-adenosylmethionine decarboxylase